jgi:dTDP-4-amino-4,6-dideoxygalactose transaminase
VKSINSAPVFKDIQTDSYEQVRFQGAMEDQNVYKGAPNHALDSAWENLLHSKYCLCLNSVTPTLGIQLIERK